ncbi:MAG: hypothetical protein D6796_12805 [Caldilineae bacterium]|nr:MAG: hypothetical protein D6796_12805 [Caldilineae bacterium]
MEENRLWWGQDGTAKYPRLKIFLSESEGLVPIDLWDYKSSGTTDEGGAQVKELFGQAVFDNPKPTKLIRRMISIATGSSDDCLVLDFFAGSCSTAQAVLEFNRDENRHHGFVMVQIPEPTPEKSIGRKAGYATIADIGKERIRRVIAKLQAETARSPEPAPAGQLPLVESDEPSPVAGPPSSVDLGFKVFRLDRSHYKEWQPLPPTEPARLDDLLAQHASPLRDGWTRDGLLAEILLLEGFPLDSRAIPLAEGFPDNDVRRIHHPDVGHELFVCLDEGIHPSTVDRLPSLLRPEDIFICLDAALTDEAKVMLDDRIRLKVI